MIKKQKLTAIVAVRAGSERVPNKNIKKFNGTTLLDIKIRQLKKINYIDEIIVSSDSKRMLNIAKKYKILTHKRETYFASSRATNSEFFQNLAENINSDYIMYAPVTAPLIKEKTIIRCIKYLQKNYKFKSVATVKLMKHHMWLNNKPLNYNVKKAPSSQDLPNIMAITFGCCILKKKDMIKFKNVVTDKTKFFELDEIESIDIDNELDFEFAQFVHKKFHKIN